ncbi:MAG TPA: DUF1801 domain-containing protein [Phycisphaerales bacterium]|nr:DUF1801 domain-containing protein [Phycisphaerales bacterium]
MQSKAQTVDAYLASLPAERRETVEAVRKTILKNIDPVFQERMQYGMIGYSVPHSVFPAGYHCDPKQPLPFAGLAAQKNAYSLYMLGPYVDPQIDRWFRESWLKTGKKLDMGKACIRFKKLDDLPLDLIGQTFKRLSAKEYIARYESNLAMTRMSKPATTKAAKKTVRKGAKKVGKKAARR